MRIVVTAMILGMALSANGAPVTPDHRLITPAPAWTQSDAVARITPEELRQLLRRRRAVIVDVRSRESFQSGHIKGALSIPIDEIEARAKELPRNKTIVTYCS